MARIKARVAELTGDIEKSDVKQSEAINAQDQVEMEQTPAGILDNASVAAKIGGFIDDDAHQGPFSSGELWTRDCNQCSLSKGRCNRAKPICGSCEERSVACSFGREDLYHFMQKTLDFDSSHDGVSFSPTAPDLVDEQARTRGPLSKLGEPLSPKPLSLLDPSVFDFGFEYHTI